MMNIMTLLTNVGLHLNGWRHPEAWDNTVLNFEQLVECAQMAERAKIDMVFLPDGSGVREMHNRELFEAMTPSSRPAVFEPVTLLSALSVVTTRIGLVATASTTYDEPFHVARRYASLDHLSKGRAGWNVVTGSNEGDAPNFSAKKHLAKDLRYEKAREFVEVVLGLWDSWADDAFIQDKHSGRYLNADRVRALEHVGDHFQVKGPLNVARSPQGRPVVFHAGQSEAGLELAAHAADCVFAVAGTLEQAQLITADLKARAVRHGRSPDSLKVLMSASIYPGATQEQADALGHALDALTSPTLALGNLSKLVAVDLSGYDVDGPMPELCEAMEGASAPRKIINAWVRKERPTIRDVYLRYSRTLGSPVFQGTALHIADQMEAWYRAGACDGFLIGPAVMPTSLQLFTREVIPELQRRGLFRTEYPGKTLRDIINLPAPPNQFFT